MSITRQVFPTTRLRRNRLSPWSRHLQRESTLQSLTLIQPVFVREATVPSEIPNFAGMKRMTPEELVPYAQELWELGVGAVMLFPVIEESKKDPHAGEVHNADGVLFNAIGLLKQHCPEVVVITDPALDPYTDHGQDGLIRDGHIDNDATLRCIAQFARAQAQAGADIIAPSEMMDGRIGVIRRHLDEHGLSNTGIMSYAAKYASCFYGPFRQAVQSSSNGTEIDKRTYQMDPANSGEALREVDLDLQEGADSVIIKPGLHYLDVISRVKQKFSIPVLGYHVSGEYACLRAAVDAGAIDYDRALEEIMNCFSRAGADGIISYGAADMRRIQRDYCG